MSDSTRDQRYARGLAVLRHIGGPDYDAQLKAAAESAPELSRLTIEFAYGEIIARDGLALPLRQVVTVAALLAHRNAERQLRYHMVGYLNAGGEARILVELLFVSIAVLGFPVAIHGIALVRDIFTERGIDFARIAPRVDDGSTALRAGHEAMARMLGDAAAPTLASWSELDTVFANWSVAFEYGEIFNRDALDARTRELAIVIMLASAGNRATALERHVEAALRAGVQHTELTEAFMQLAVYAGFPTALNAITTASAVFKRGAPSTSAASAPTSPAAAEPRAARHARGLDVMARTSRGAGTTVIAGFDDIAPDIGHAIVEHAYGDVFARDAISLRIRELAACAAFAAVGNQVMATPLRVHVLAALNTGATREEITEVLLNLVPHCGYPTVEHALAIANEVFADAAQQV